MKSSIHNSFPFVCIFACLFLISGIVVAKESPEEFIKIGNKQIQELNIIEFDSSNPKNIILLIGDGMGPNQVSLVRIAAGGPEYRLAIDMMPYIGVVLTHSINNIYTDSASSATAYSTGEKTINGYIALDSKKEPLQILTEELHKKGYANGLVATSSITHATPAAFYARVDDRDKEIEIAKQLVKADFISIALGGGQDYFKKIKDSNINFIYSLDDLDELDATKDSRIIGLFDKDGIMRDKNKPTQQAMTKKALNFLTSNADSCNRFFLMSEGSQIDWAGHMNNTEYLLAEFDDFDKTIRDIMEFINLDKNTLLVVTADHETGGLQLLGQKDNTLTIKYTTQGHSALPVNVYAYGPGADNFTGTMDNTDIYKKISKITSLSRSICN